MKVVNLLECPHMVYVRKLTEIAHLMIDVVDVNAPILVASATLIHALGVSKFLVSMQSKYILSNKTSCINLSLGFDLLF